MAASQTLLSSHTAQLVSLSLSDMTSHFSVCQLLPPAPLPQSQMVPHFSRHDRPSKTYNDTGWLFLLSLLCWVEELEPQTTREQEKTWGTHAAKVERAVLLLSSVKNNIPSADIQGNRAEVCLDGTRVSHPTRPVTVCSHTQSVKGSLTDGNLSVSKFHLEVRKEGSWLKRPLSVALRQHLVKPSFCI